MKGTIGGWLEHNRYDISDRETSFFAALNSISSLGFPSDPFSVVDEYAVKHLHDLEYYVWGVDARQRCFFLVFRSVLTGRRRTAIEETVIPFQDKCADWQASSNTDSLISPCEAVDTKDAPKGNTLRYTDIIKIDLQCIGDFVLVVNETECIENRKNVLFLHELCCSALSKLAIFRSVAFENQVSSISSSASANNSDDFLRKLCDELKWTFSAASVSIWSVSGEKVSAEYFSDGHKTLKDYRLGQGLTGNVAKHCSSIFLHKIADAKEIYNIDWMGHVSDFESRNADPNDHIIIIPVKYDNMELNGGKPADRILRLVSSFEVPSFWPIDYIRAEKIVESISIVLSKVSSLKRYRQTTDVQYDIIEMLKTIHPSSDPQDIYISFMEKIANWEGVRSVSFVDRKGDLGFNFSECTFLSKIESDIFTESSNASSAREVLSNNGCLAWPIISSDQIVSYLVLKFEPKYPDHMVKWIELIALIVGYLITVGRLIIEAKNLRIENEESEIRALSGTVYRLYAHEALNGAKSLRAWLERARKGNVDLSLLSERVHEIYSNVNDLLDETDFVKLRREKCLFNAEIERALKRLGFSNEKKFDGCRISLSLKSIKHRYVDIDPSILMPIVNNLVINAKEQYTQHGKVGPIEISTFEREADGELFVGFSVRDYAVGIPDARLSQIYKSGFTTKPGGKGIGLWLVKKLVEGCDGSLEVSTTYGYGATFFVAFAVIL